MGICRRRAYPSQPSRWRGDIERNSVLFGQHSNGVGANFVGDITVSSNAISAQTIKLDLAFASLSRRHVVRDDRGRDAVFHQFPCGQTRTLQEWSCLVGVDVNLLVSLPPLRGICTTPYVP